jgi:hypothetical protein
VGRTKAQHPRRQRPATPVLAAPAGRAADSATTAAAGVEVVVEGFHDLHPEVDGWDMQRWLLADGDGTDDGQFAAYELQDHLDEAPHITADQAVALRSSTVTMHYFLRTDFDGDTGISYLQGVLYSPAAGWIAVERPWDPADADSDGLPASLAWSAPALDQLLAAIGDNLADLKASLDPGVFECCHLSYRLRTALQALPARA